ncbi:putative bifunctional diguanylate cyclase/phosphodiesterase [Hoeflea alexandrii]|uniref:putative bifunctional diguanylate cyclase/phosphodiesterase n=1 Tax=Hoeflea alexandrii TaxID=288436 RepID=UPI0022AFEE7F|nr:bifunctional diguanylate cyclase/phosphodiesterase [Hoeflea alexandrii]MCZ4289965.1 EAL domain-containing protein [Hoeflea alexandrii]
MMTILDCVVDKHNIWLLAVAATVCASGSWAIICLFERASRTTGLQRAGWHFLSAVAAGAAIWCTHFIAMLAYQPGAPVSFDPLMTIVSLLTAIVGAGAGFLVAASSATRFAPAIGGATVGIAIAVMHYTGMMAYRVRGIISWDTGYLFASVVLSVVLSALAIHLVAQKPVRSYKPLSAGVFFLAIISLHFTGMTAFQVTPLLVDNSFSNPAAMQALALAVATVALVIVGAGLASYIIDDSVRTESLDRLRHMALNDSLTGLPNRTSFADRLDHEIDIANETGGKVALIGIDLDRFKEVNDLRGHAVGDLLLGKLGARLAAVVQDGEFVARTGGDEFAAIKRYADHAQLEDFLVRLENVLFEPVREPDFDIAPGASLGVAIYPDNASTLEVLINNADLAMYRAKADSTHHVCYYDQSMDDIVRARRSLANDLRVAIDKNELEVHYQVQTSVSTNQIRGFEALLRWNHPERGYIPPVEFIPLAEESGLILQLGEWVLRQACADAASWSPPYKVAVNLSPAQFAHADLHSLIIEVLMSSGLPANRLELELTESTIFQDKERSFSVLRQIKALGVNIALDDFGTGYSSLDMLRYFPFDKIKLDRSFIHEAEGNLQAKSIIRAVLALGKSLEIPVLAEGIETEGQLELLGDEGCDEAQGFLLGRPIPIGQLVESGRISLNAPTESTSGTERKPSPQAKTDIAPKSRIA